jgi:hypothetical protein
VPPCASAPRQHISRPHATCHVRMCHAATRNTVHAKQSACDQHKPWDSDKTVQTACYEHRPQWSSTSIRSSRSMVRWASASLACHTPAPEKITSRHAHRRLGR